MEYRIPIDSSTPVNEHDAYVLSQWTYYDELYSKCKAMAAFYARKRDAYQKPMYDLLCRLPKKELPVCDLSERDAQHARRYGCSALLRTKTYVPLCNLTLTLVKGVLEEVLGEILEEEQEPALITARLLAELKEAQQTEQRITTVRRVRKKRRERGEAESLGQVFERSLFADDFLPASPLPPTPPPASPSSPLSSALRTMTLASPVSPVSPGHSSLSPALSVMGLGEI